MKIKNINYLLVFAIIAITVIYTSCRKGDFDSPPVHIPKFDIPAGAKVISIAELKARHTISGALDSIKGDTIVQGIVVSSDSAGNLYKFIVIQDTSGGLMINIDNSSLYTTYKLGQKLYIKCKNLVLGDYGTMTQLGVINSGAIGRILDANKGNYIFKDGLALKSNLPAPKEVSLINNLLLPSDLCKLVKINNVAFIDSGQVYSVSSGSTNRNIVDASGVALTVRNSNYALFAGSLLPKGRGSVTGIFTVFTTTKQLLIRDLNDVVGFRNY